MTAGFDPSPLLRQVELGLNPKPGGFIYGGSGIGGLESWPKPTDGQIAEQLGVSARTIQRWRHGATLPRPGADRLAVRAGFHPVELWPTWYSL